MIPDHYETAAPGVNLRQRNRFTRPDTAAAHPHSREAPHSIPQTGSCPPQACTRVRYLTRPLLRFCSTIKIDVPRSLILVNFPETMPRITGDRPADGSSRRRKSGESMSARPIPTVHRSPPLIEPALIRYLL